jgi:GTP-binding protein EngB required for normal cell division
VDARHPGLSSDLDAWAWLGSQPCARAVVGTKVDKLTQAERVRHARTMENVFEMPVALVSAHTGEGLDELWKMIASLPRTAA